jgi:4-amino-4-deoxy-L-arabinose transferase-like glycosyltransferase
VKVRFAAVGLLLILFGLLVTTLPVTSPTADEPMYMVRGYAFVSRGQDRMAGCSPCSPVLSSALSGAALWLEPHLKPLPPVADAIWSDDGGTGIFEYFVWSPGAPTSRIIFLTRLPIIFITVLLGALIFRWAVQRSGRVGALGALAFYVFCPNILAHGRLVTADVVTAATFTLSAYAFDRALQTSRRSWRMFSGVALGLALASKVSAVALPVAFVIWALIVLWPQRHDRSAWRGACVTWLTTIAVGGVALWGLYRFSIGPIDPGGPIVPAPAYWADWQAVMRNQTAPLPAYLFGDMTTQGWWYYYPITFLVKSSLPELILSVLVIVRLLLTRRWSRDLPLLIVPAAIFSGLLFSTHNLGYRYVLPVLPFLFVASADVVAAAMRKRWMTIGIGLLLVWQIGGTLRTRWRWRAYLSCGLCVAQSGRR